MSDEQAPPSKGRETFSRGFILGLRFDTRYFSSGRAYITVRGNDSVSQDCACIEELESVLDKLEDDIAEIRKLARGKFSNALKGPVW